MVKEFLSRKGISFTEKDVSVDQSAARELVNRTKQMGVPVTFIDGVSIIGFNRPRLEEILTQHQSGHPYSFGAVVADANKIAARQGPGVLAGAYVGKINTASAAEKLGLTAGDIIVEVNSQNIVDAAGLALTLSKIKTGSSLTVVFLRDRKRLTAEGVL